MDSIVITRNKIFGLYEVNSGISDYDYFKILPNYINSVGVFATRFAAMLPQERIDAIDNNLLFTLKVTCNSVFSRTERYIVYKLNNMDPVLYEIPGYNCIINFKTEQYDTSDIKKVHHFFCKEYDFTSRDFDNLEYYTNYIICTTYEGNAFFIYTTDNFIYNIISVFNEMCMKKSGSNIELENIKL